MSELDEQIHDNLEEEESHDQDHGDVHKTIHLSGMYENWFLDYASYVILSVLSRI